MMQSKELTEFYQAYAAWLDAGAPQYEPFNTYNGLCSAIMRHHTLASYNGLLEEMKAQFRAARLSANYPFEKGRLVRDKAREYFTGANADHKHLNSKRIAWVRAHAAI